MYANCEKDFLLTGRKAAIQLTVQLTGIPNPSHLGNNLSFYPQDPQGLRSEILPPPKKANGESWVSPVMNYSLHLVF